MPVVRLNITLQPDTEKIIRSYAEEHYISFSGAVAYLAVRGIAWDMEFQKVYRNLVELVGYDPLERARLQNK